MAVAFFLSQSPAGAAGDVGDPVTSPDMAAPQATARPSTLNWIQSQPSYAAGAVGSGAQASVNAMRDLGHAVGEFGWEVTFALGINSVPLRIPNWNPFAETADDLSSGQRETAAVDTPTPAAAEKAGPMPVIAPLAEPASAPRAEADAAAPSGEAAAFPGAVTPASAPAALTAPVIAALPAESAPGESRSDAKRRTGARPGDEPTASELAAAVGPQAVAPSSPVSPEIIAHLLGDQPRRETDGTFFVPKAAQRLLDIRTARADDSAVPVSVKLAGRIIADPNAHGVVEATIAGRIEPPAEGLPVLGQQVRKGDVLASVVPAIGVVDRTQIRRDVARLTNEIRVATENIEILKQFWFVPYREGKIIQAEIQLRGLRRERAALLPLLDTREVLRAPTDGVVSVIKAIAGQVVQPGTPVFDIVNPGRLWVEASAPSPEIATVAASGEAAAAVTPEGQALDLRFVGTGLTTRQQATLLQFRIQAPPEGLRVDRPVTVIVASRDQSRHGVVVPRESVVTGASGLDEVWEHVDPEHFRARPVHTEPLDGRHMLVVDGLPAGSRVVVRSARLLAQYE